MDSANATPGCGQQFFIPSFIRGETVKITSATKYSLITAFAIPYFLGVGIPKICKLLAQKIFSLLRHPKTSTDTTVPKRTDHAQPDWTGYQMLTFYHTPRKAASNTE